MKKRLYLMMAAILTVCGTITTQAQTADDSGTCGENLTWTYVESTQTLTISGTGAMADYKDSPWIKYNNNIKKVVVENGVTTIGRNAFKNCYGLISATISDNVTSIGNAAFFYCSSLNSINFPSALTFIGDSAFFNCGRLTSLNIPNTVTHIGSTAFCYCSGLTSIKIPDGLTAINDSTFYKCGGLTSISIPDAVTTIGKAVFFECMRLTSITIPNGVKAIGENAFRSCANLASVTIGNSVTSIGKNAFTGCWRLTSISIPDNVSELSDEIFWVCSNLETLNLPSKLTKIGKNALDGCTNLKELNLPTTLQEVDSYAFKNCKSLTTLTFPASMTTLEDYAFSGCSKLVLLDFRACTKLNISKNGNNGNIFDGVPESTRIIWPGEGGETKIPYAIWCESNKTLFFTHRAEDLKAGDQFIPEDASATPVVITNVWSWADVINSGNTIPAWRNTVYRSITTVVFEPSFINVKPTSTSAWFNTYNVSDYTLTTIKGLEYLNTEDVTTMQYMFYDNQALQSLDLSHFNTSKVTNMNEIFYRCKSLTELDVSSFDTRSATTMLSMFDGCSGLTSLDVSNFDTRNVTSMKYMFQDCQQLKKIDLSNFNTEKVTDISYMFDACVGLEEVNLSSFNTSNVTTTEAMFANCHNIKTIDLSALNTSSVQNMWKMFLNCYQLKTIYVDGDLWDTSKVTLSSEMFKDCSNVVGGKGTTFDANHIDKGYAHIDGGTSNPGYLTQKGAAVVIIGEAEPYAVLSADNKTLTFYYDTNKEANGGMGVGPFTFDNGVNSGWYSNRFDIQTVVFDKSFADYHGLTSTAYWFDYFLNLTTITGMENLNTENVTDMRSMFYDCASLKTLDVSHFNTENVIYMDAMFDACAGLTSLDVSNFNTSNVKSMYGMFEACISLTSLDLSNFDTKNVEHMESMFFKCSSLTTIYVGGNWNLDNCKGGRLMFHECTSLVGGQGTVYDAGHTDMSYAHIDGGTNNPGYFTGKGQTVTDPEDDIIHFVDAEVKRICVTNWDTSGDGELSYKEAKVVTDLNKLFAGNKKITSFDELQYFTGLKDLNYQEGGQFDNCENLETITLPNGLEKIGEATFNYCRALKGIRIPASVKEMSYLGGWYFGMTTITVDKNNTVYDSRNNCNAVIEKATNTLISGCGKTVIPNSVEAIGPFAFNACASEPIEIPSSVTTIGKSAFSTCQFTEVNLPSSITNIDVSFVGCTQIKTVVSNISEPFAINDATFPQTVYDNAILWVPTEEAVDKYMTTNGWRKFLNIKEMSLTPTINKVMDYSEDGSLYENTNLEGTIIDNVYYNITPENGGFDAEDKCIVVYKAMTDEEINTVFGNNLFSNEVKTNFTGLVIEVPAGNGKVTINAQTTGDMMLKVKIGSADPVEMELEGKLKAKFPYNVTEPTLVYIYAGSPTAASRRKLTKTGEKPSLRIYGINVEEQGDPNGNGMVDERIMDISVPTDIYTLDGRLIRKSATSLDGLPKGIYLIRPADGRIQNKSDKIVIR